MNLGNMREVDCFVTNTEYELVPNIEKTILEFEIDDIGNATTFDNLSNTNVKEYITELNKTEI